MRTTPLTRPDPSIRAIVPARNAADGIGPCIEGLFAAGFCRTDIVVVDDASTDGTATRCRTLGVEVIALTRNAGAAGARNAGAASVASDILFFVDSDVVVACDVRTVLQDFFTRHPDYAAAFGTYDDRPAAPGSTSQVRNLLHRHVHLEGAGDASTFWTGCGAVRRSDFERLGGFDASLRMMEDVEFGLRLHASGRRIRLEPALQGRHLKHWSLAGMIRTDLFDRAIPWARLLSAPRHRATPATLNIGRRARFSVLSVASSLIGLAVAPVLPVAGAAAMLLSISVLAIVNSHFLSGLWRNQAPALSFAAVPILWVHYFCGGLGFFWVRSGLDAVVAGAADRIAGRPPMR